MVACVDGSGASETVLPVALAWCRALDMALTIATVVEDAPPSLQPDERPGPYGPSGEPEVYLDRLVAGQQGAGVEESAQLVRDPIGPASGMRTYLDQEPAGLVALATHARSGMQRIHAGAGAASIAHASISPCLVIPVRG